VGVCKSYSMDSLLLSKIRDLATMVTNSSEVLIVRLKRIAELRK
jgi:hypothetical protein